MNLSHTMSAVHWGCWWRMRWLSTTRTIRCWTRTKRCVVRKGERGENVSLDKRRGHELDRSHAVVAGVVFDFGEAQEFEHGRDVVGEAASESFLEAVPALHGIAG